MRRLLTAILMWGHRRRVARPLAVLTALCCLDRQSAHAQNLEQQVLEQGGLGHEAATGRWSVVIGTGPAVVPHYPGARDDRISVVPLISASHSGETPFFFGPFGLGFSPINVGGFHAGPIIGLMPNRRQSDDPHLNGLGDISTSATAGVFALYRVGPVAITTAVEQAITHTGNGLMGLGQIDYHMAIVPGKLELHFGPELEFGNAVHQRTWFGVTPLQSASSGLPVFTPGGGIINAGMHAGLNYRYSQHVLLRAFADVKRLTGDTADSPIVERSTQEVTGVGIAYRF
jgi:MipA family protein